MLTDADVYRALALDPRKHTALLGKATLLTYASAGLASARHLYAN